MSWWRSRAEPPSPRRADVVCSTLMLELSWQMKDAERQQRERDTHDRRARTGVDYSWLASVPRNTYDISPGERMALEELCAKVPPSHCGRLVFRFRQVLVQNEPDVREVSVLFRSVLLEVLDNVREEEEAQRLSRQWKLKRTASVTLSGFRSRVRIEPCEVKTVSEDVERGMGRSERNRRVWSMPEFKLSGGGAS